MRSRDWLTWTHWATLTKRNISVLAFHLRTEHTRTRVLTTEVSLARDWASVACATSAVFRFETFTVSVHSALEFTIGTVGVRIVVDWPSGWVVWWGIIVSSGAVIIVIVFGVVIIHCKGRRGKSCTVQELYSRQAKDCY